MSSSPETELLAANDAFYEAFARCDLDAIDALWAEHAPVACIHPGWDALHGRDEVMASFRAILGDGEGPPIRCVRPEACILGEAAYVVCAEALGATELIATNIFVREDGRWKIVHHQAGPVNRRVRPKAKSKPPTMLN